jgi:hypothetical protein
VETCLSSPILLQRQPQQSEPRILGTPHTNHHREGFMAPQEQSHSQRESKQRTTKGSATPTHLLGPVSEA